MQNNIAIFNFPRQSGIVTLAVTLLLSAIIVEIVIIGAVLAYTVTNSNYAARLSAEALSAAKAGVSDALIKIIRDKHFGANPSYELSIGGRSVEVTVCKDAKTGISNCDTPSIGEREITSVGKALTRRQKIRAIVDVDAVTGEARVVSITELAS